ncbi:MAG: hypothetical protein GKR94_07685 [Gammaproteobacteria bacterium]|nr:hypothetical protein [Gammaproteobacteria bacterium]
MQHCVKAFNKWVAVSVLPAGSATASGRASAQKYSQGQNYSQGDHGDLYDRFDTMPFKAARIIGGLGMHFACAAVTRIAGPEAERELFDRTFSSAVRDRVNAPPDINKKKEAWDR